MSATKLELLRAKLDEKMELSEQDINFLMDRCSILLNSIKHHQDKCIKEYGEVILPMDKELHQVLDEDYDPKKIAKQTKKKR